MVSTVKIKSPRLMDANIRVNISLSPHDFERLKLWALSHGKTATGYASQIVAARIEANHQIIDQQIKSLAESKGISVEELKQLALSEED